MNRFACVFGLILLSLSLSAQVVGPDRGLEVDVATHLNASLFSSHWTADASAVYALGPLALGGGVRTYVPLAHRGFYWAPYARGELSWFYLGIGTLFLPVQPEDDPGWATVDDTVGFLGMVGAQIPLIPVGSSRFGIDAGAEISVTPSPVLEAEGEGAILGTIVATVLGAAFNIFKVNLGVYYSYSF